MHCNVCVTLLSRRSLLDFFKNVLFLHDWKLVSVEIFLAECVTNESMIGMLTEILQLKMFVVLQSCEVSSPSDFKSIVNFSELAK